VTMGVQVEWYARGGDIAKMGPFRTQEEASRALMTTEGHPIEGAFVWPVEVKDGSEARDSGVDES